MISFFLLGVLAQGALEPMPGRNELAQFLSGFSADVKDFEFVCECRTAFLDDTDPDREEKKTRFNQTIQSSYVWRVDSAIYLDIFAKAERGDRPLLRDTYALLNAQLKQSVRLADDKALPPIRVVSGTGPASIMTGGCPQRFVLAWFWRSFIANPELWEYRAEGWESIDGNRCLRFVLRSEGATPNSPVTRYWMDLSRDGNVLRQEYIVANERWFRVQNVRLSRFDLPNKRKNWFPVHAEFESFGNGDRFLDTPVLSEVFDVVKGSLVFNKNPPDSRFSLAWKSENSSSDALRQAKREFDHTPPAPKPPPLRTDPTGVQRYQEEKLAEADRQATQLDASTPSERYFTLTTITLASLVLVGSSCLMIAAYFWKRQQ